VRRQLMVPDLETRCEDQASSCRLTPSTTTPDSVVMRSHPKTNEKCSEGDVVRGERLQILVVKDGLCRRSHYQGLSASAVWWRRWHDLIDEPGFPPSWKSAEFDVEGPLRAIPPSVGLSWP